MYDPHQTTILATNTVLDRLGRETSEIIKWYLGKHYSIYLEADCLFAVEEIAIAMQRLVGESEARSIMQEIRQEIVDLSSMQRLATRQKNNAFSFWQVD